MTALVRAELLKLRTLRSTAWAAAALLVITVLTGTLAMGDAGEKGYRTPDQLRETVIAIGYTAVFFMVVLGAVAAAGEYRHRTISQRFLVSPDRGRVLAAKLAAFGLVGFVTALFVTVAGRRPGRAGRQLQGLHARPRRRRAAHRGRRRARRRAGGDAGRRRRLPHPQPDDRHGGDLRHLDRREDRRRVARRGRRASCPTRCIENVLGLPAALSFGAAAAALVALTAALALVARRTVLPRDVT